MNGKMTLRELLTRISSTRGIEHPPTMKRLRESGEPVATHETAEYRMAVYPIGFALVISEGRYTVVRADACRGYTYRHKPAVWKKLNATIRNLAKQHH